MPEVTRSAVDMRLVDHVRELTRSCNQMRDILAAWRGNDSAAKLPLPPPLPIPPPPVDDSGLRHAVEVLAGSLATACKLMQSDAPKLVPLRAELEKAAVAARALTDAVYNDRFAEVERRWRGPVDAWLREAMLMRDERDKARDGWEQANAKLAALARVSVRKNKAPSKRRRCATQSGN